MSPNDSSDSQKEAEVHWRDGHVFQYSDPDEAEQYLESVIRAARDRSTGSEELSAQIRDWTSFYHLTPRRCDLLRPLLGFISGDVLEVGAGCGAITRYLGENARSVVAVEGSERRARIMASRCAGLKNVSIHCDNFEDADLGGRRFDAVLSIGVIEYGNKFFRGPNGFDRMLGRMAEFLTEAGVLIIAIENRLGLKYFAGAPEDHTSRAFEGIQDLYEPSSVLTLGRKEWLRRLAEQGLEPVHWLFPWPDYKAPELIVSEAAFRESGFDIASWIRRHTRGRQDSPAGRLFSEALAWRSLARNGITEDLANSFLIVARRAGSRPHVEVPGLLWEFETERRRAYAVETRVTGENGGFVFSRRQLYPEVPPPSPAVRLALGDDRLPSRPRHDDALDAILNRTGWTVGDVVKWARPWLDFLKGALAETGTGCLPSELLDYSPGNLLRNPDGTLEPWGMEFAANEPLPFEFVVFRGLWNAFAGTHSCAAPAGGFSVVLVNLVCACLAELGLALPAAVLDDCLAREARFRHALTGLPADQHLRLLTQQKLNIRSHVDRSEPGGFDAQLFWRTSRTGFSEAASRTVRGHLEPGRQRLSFSVPPLGEALVELRLDLADRPGIAILYQLRLLMPTGQPIWVWDGAASSLQSAPRADLSFAAHGNAVVARIYGRDPALILPIPASAMEKAGQGAVCEIEFAWIDVFQYLRESEAD